MAAAGGSTALVYVQLSSLQSVRFDPVNGRELRRNRNVMHLSMRPDILLRGVHEGHRDIKRLRRSRMAGTNMDI